MSTQPAVITENLTKKYGDFVALDNLSIQLDKGHILGFIGPNGAGKTTTIKILVGLSKATSGKASIAGVDCVKNPHKIKRLVGYMPDVFGSYENMRVREYLDFFGAAFKIPVKQRTKRIDECMDITGSSYMRDRYVEALSHGMKQRVAIARTLLHDPAVMILDEPANGLDPQARIDMRQILLRLADMGKTLIVTSHILPELSRICDTVAIITHGKLRAFGTLDKIMHNIDQRRVMQVQLSDAKHVEQVTTLLKKYLEDDAKITPSKAEGEIRFTTRCDDDTLSKIIAALGANNLSVIQFHEVPLDLEDAFMSVTKQSNLASGDRE